MNKTIVLLAILVLWNVSAQNGKETPDGVSKEDAPTQNKAFILKTDINLAVKSLDDQSTKSAISSRQISSPLKIDSYYFANLAFNLQYYFPFCKRC